MSDVRVVVFTKNNARVLINPPHLGALKKRHNVLINPDLTRVLGCPPHLWKIVKGEIWPMGHAERLARERVLELTEADNDHEAALMLTKWERRVYSPLAWLCVVIASASFWALVYLLLRRR